MADRIDIFTTAMRSEFLTGYNFIAKPAPIDQALMRINSTSREENFAWISPAPGVDKYQGYRRWYGLSTLKYKVVNVEYDLAFEALLRDINDDQVSAGFQVKAKDLGLKAKLYPERAVIKNLAAGKSTPCFDGSNFFAASHTIGVGNNIITGTAAATDGIPHNLVALVTVGPIKPLGWMDRHPPDLQNDAGSTESQKLKMVRFWCDFEGAPFYGLWHDAILVQYSNTPTLAELQKDFGTIEGRFRSFQIPQSQTTDAPEYAHEQLQFSKDNLLLVTSPGLGSLVRQALSLSLINNTENGWVGWANYVTTNLLNTVT